MTNRRPVIEEAFELARSGRYRVPSEVRRALVEKRYTQAELFQLEGKATWAQLRTLCADARYPAGAGSVQPG
ncbi:MULTISPECIES: hypothetical protein [unclassified Brevundimonas]|uniref:hypothetical protein n=1 Tax=unclassified Brevundimonas TaxID=2622653 RepID=UPI003F92C674